MHAVPADIGTRLHDLTKVTRRLKQRRSAVSSAVPAGSLGLLIEIDATAVVGDGPVETRDRF